MVVRRCESFALWLVVGCGWFLVVDSHPMPSLSLSPSLPTHSLPYLSCTTARDEKEPSCSTMNRYVQRSSNVPLLLQAAMHCLVAAAHDWE